jgi:hypothetical protein
MAVADRGAINPGEVLRGNFGASGTARSRGSVAAYSLAEENDRFFLSLIFDGSALFENEQDIPSSHPTMAHLSPETRFAYPVGERIDGCRQLMRLDLAEFIEDERSISCARFFDLAGPDGDGASLAKVPASRNSFDQP